MRHREKTIAWLESEYEYVVSKFGDNQAPRLRSSSLTDPTNFGGQAAMFWKRMIDARRSDQPLRAAQAAGKLASSNRSLFATIRSLSWRSDRPILTTSLEIAEASLDGYQQAKTFVEKTDFWETPIGLGISYLERSIQKQGWEDKFRLSYLLRAQQIFEDSTQVMAVQFDWTQGEIGQLPRPGLSSGNLEPWE